MQIPIMFETELYYNSSRRADSSGTLPPVHITLGIKCKVVITSHLAYVILLVICVLDDVQHRQREIFD